MSTGEGGALFLTAIQQNTISLYYSYLKNINFDETIDMLPTNNKETNQPQDVLMQSEDQEMQRFDENPN